MLQTRRIFYLVLGGFDKNTGQSTNQDQNQPTIFKLRLEGDNEIDSRNLEYDVSLRVKIDYFLHRRNRIIHATQVRLIQNQCEVESTQVLTFLTMALKIRD